ncbi:hypothetical protein [Limnochorda pilosa]|uniref:hypothetical protein n=1 Tax=Limnochorda pilosa TaxID=1555112 RepID=UPI000832B6E9|nr:hypothetical protein [Limnochorda pilosa]
MPGQTRMEKLAVELESSINDLVRKLRVIARHAEALATELGAGSTQEAGAREAPPTQPDTPPRS